jgi:predicted outer membrane repeat protein
MLASLTLTASPASSQDADSTPADRPPAAPSDDDASGDTAGADDVAPTGPDSHEQAAAQNDVLEDAAAAASDDTVPGPPIVPQSTGVPTIVTEPDADADGDAGPVFDAQPAEGATAPVSYANAAPGTSSTISFVDAAPLGAVLAEGIQFTAAVQEEIDSAARARVVTLAVPDLSSDLAAESVTVQLFDDVSLEMVTAVAPSQGQLNSTMWSSVPAVGADGNPFGVVTMIDDRVYGGWWHGDTAYEMIPLGNGDHLLFEVGRDFDGDPEAWDMGPVVDNGPSGLTGAELGLSEDDGGDLTEDTIAAPNIDVMVAYDAEVATALGSHQAAVDLAILNINLSNVTFLNSGAEAPQNFTLTNVYATGYTPTTSTGNTYKTQLANKTDGTFDAIHTVRDANFADFVVLLFDRTMFGSSGGTLCGTALFPTSANPAENDAYNITKRSCATTTALTVPHDLGHNQCAGHDVTGGGCTTYTVDNGYVDASTNQRTIMARNSNTCCTRRPVWSNPSITWNGWTPGTASTDNNFVLEQEDLSPGTVSGGVANYRVNPVGTNSAVAGTDGVSCAFNTIEDAITLAPAGSTIFISPGTHSAQAANVNFNISKNLDLEQGTNLCGPTVSGAASNVVLTLAAGSTVDAVLEVTSGAQVRIERITVQGGNSAEGTLEVESGADVTLDAAVVQSGNNPSTTTGGGGARIIGSTSSLTQINNSQIQNNSSSFGGGGVFIDDGLLVMNGPDDIDNNNALDGGGIYAQNNATIDMSSNADVFTNTATDQGGGVYLDDSNLTAVDAGTNVLSNSAGTGQGGGIYATNGSISVFNSGSAIGSNTAEYGAGAWVGAAGSEIEVNDGALVTSNTATVNGGGIMVSGGALADLNSGSSIVGNTAAGVAGGVAVLFPASLDADGGTPTVDPVLIDNNTAGTFGGGVYSSGTSNLDTVHIEDNDASDGGGIYVVSSGVVNLTEGFSCVGGVADLGFERYCNELSRNTATGTGSGIAVAGGTLTAVQIGFLANTGGRGVVFASGAADVDIRAAMVLSNSTGVGDGVVTAIDTANINIVGVTFADNDQPAMDSDASTSIWNVARVISDTGVHGLTNTSGSCNVKFPGQPGGMPGQVSVDPRFEPSPDSAYMPAPFGYAGDRCALLGGHGTDVFDSSVQDADGLASATEYDIGGIEADRQPILQPFFSFASEGDTGISILPVPVNLDIASSEPITIDWQTLDTGGVGIATANVDYIAASGSLTFLPGSTQEFIDLTIIGDTVAEVDALFGEWVLLAFSNISENAEFDNQFFFGVGIGIIGNDDGPT